VGGNWGRVPLSKKSGGVGPPRPRPTTPYLLVKTMSCAETAEATEKSSGVWTRMDPKKSCTRLDQDPLGEAIFPAMVKKGISRMS